MTNFFKFGQIWGYPSPLRTKLADEDFRGLVRYVSPIERFKNGDDHPASFREIWGKFLVFGPSSGGTANCSWRGIQHPVEKMVFFDIAKFGRGRVIGGRYIRGQTKLEFPLPEYENPIRVPMHGTGAQKHYRQSHIIKLFHIVSSPTFQSFRRHLQTFLLHSAYLESVSWTRQKAMCNLDVVVEA